MVMPINWKKSKSLPSSFNNVRKTPNQFYSLLNPHFFLNQFTIHLPHVQNLVLLTGWLFHELIMPCEQSNVAKRSQVTRTGAFLPLSPVPRVWRLCLSLGAPTDWSRWWSQPRQVDQWQRLQPGVFPCPWVEKNVENHVHWTGRVRLFGSWAIQS